MTPLTSSRNLSDDFVLTLSDHDDLSSVSEDSGSDAIAGPSDNIATGIVKSTNGKIENKSKRKSKGEGKKRKRVAEEKQDHGGRGSKKAKWKGTEMNGLEGSDSESGEVGEDDGAMDPDFEFDVAGLGGGILGGVEEFDGWGVDDTVEKGTRGGKKGVDLEGIIERRRKKDDVVEEVAGEAGEAEPEGESDEESLEGLDDDELLAEDGFGMGVAADENEDSGDEEDEEAVDGGMGSEDQASDSDSVASPVAHPDDLGAGSDSDESDAPEEKARQKAFFAPEEAEPSNSTSSTSTFQSFSLSRPILRGIASVGFTTPTPIQHKTIPVALRGIDVVGGAVTGSGKTAAFIIPILERLLYRPRKVPTSRVAVLMPTRELAVQCFNVATKLASYTDITFCQLVGGFSLREQEMVLKKRPDVIIATPGRFIDHMRNSASFTIDTLEILVLDEADRMLEDGFADELNEILTTIPKSRQTMLFSATMTDTVDKLIRVGLNRPARLMVDAKKRTVTTLVQEFVRLRPGREDKRMGYLLLLCKTIYANRVIVFFRQKKEAHRARIIFGLLGIKAGELHGSMTQEQRIKAVESFRSGVHTHLLATDLASRGLDISNVHTVLNYEAPQSHSIYLHRVGRTARAGRSGRACTLAAEPDRKVVKAAVKAARAQGAKVVSRVIETEAADSWAEKVAALDDEVDEILKEEKEEKQLMQIEMNVTKGENIIKYEDEIKGRPKRTWFENEADKRAAKTAGKKELNGPEIVGKEKKGKLSGKDKKKLDLRRERTEGKVWKKGRENRKPGGARGADAKGKVKSKAKSKSKPTQKGKMGGRRR